MATDYTLDLKATLDTSEAEAKLSQLQQQGNSMGGGTGQAFQPLEKSIDKLNHTIEAMNKDGGVQMKSVMRMFAGRYIGGALRKQASAQIEAGNTGTGIALGGFGGAMKGAMSLSFLGPAGMAAGAAFGALNSSLELLGKVAEKTKNRILEQARVQQEQNNRWHKTKRTVEQEQELREFTSMSDEELIRITKELPSAKAALEDFTTGVAGKKFAEATKVTEELEAPQTMWETFLRDIGWNKQENRTEKNFIAKRDEKLKELNDAIEKATYRAAEAQKILEARGMQSIYGTRGEFDKAKTLTGLLAPTTTLAQKGFDVGGYGGFASIEQQQLAKQNEIAIQSKQVANETRKLTLVSQNLYNYIINRDMIPAKRIGANYQ